MQVTSAWFEGRPTTVRCGAALLTCGLALLTASGARAQVVHTHSSYNDMLHQEALAKRAEMHPPVQPESDDGLSGGGFYLEADEMVQREDAHHVEANGRVEARYRGRVMRADHIDYNSTTGVVVATGHVEVLGEDGTAQFADQITLDKTLSEGFATGFATRLQQHVKIAAASVRRRSGEVTELSDVIYTPCQVCAENGERNPTWSIRARSVVENKRRKSLTFRDAVIEIKGQPVFYLPILVGADPTSARKSGLLLPLVTFSGERGFSYEQPYYQVLSPSRDITVAPQINSKVNPFLNVDMRKRYYSGIVDVRAGFTHDQDFTSGGDKFGVNTWRSYVLASGVFRLDSHWRVGFTAERTSDKLIFDKYSIGDVFIDRGLYAADDRRLISQIYVERQSDQSYLSAAAIDVQGLRVNDLQRTFPVIAPLIEARWEPKHAILGGRLRLQGSAVVLTADQAIVPSPSLDGGGRAAADSRRATAEADWERTITFRNGLRIVPFVDGRLDVYSVDGQKLKPPGATVTREYGAIGATVSYPFVRSTPAATWIVEPIALVSISPNIKRDPRIPNDDSIDFQFDETNLFRPNRSPGYDLIESGQSITLGGRATVNLPDGRGGSATFGERLAASNDLAIPGRTGLRNAFSDYVFAADATPWKDIWLFSRLRVSSNNLAVNYFEVGAKFATSRLSGYVSYLQEARSPSFLPVVAPIVPVLKNVQVPGSAKVKSLDVHGEAFLTRHWGLTGYAIVDDGAWRRQDIGVVYRDDCIRVEVLYRHDETFNGTLGPTTSVVLRLTLATLGAKQYVNDPRAGF